MKRSLTLLALAIVFLSSYGQADFNSITNEISFTPNRGQLLNTNGQTAQEVLAKASVPGMDLYLTTKGLSYVFLNYEEDKDAPVHPVYINDKQYKVHYSRVDIDLVGASLTAAQTQWTQPTNTRTNHYYGNIHVEGVEHYRQVTIANVYPGIDWVWKVNDKQQLEYDFVVHPFSDPSQIKMQYRFATPEVAGSYVKVQTKNGTLTEGALLARNGNADVPVTYTLTGKAVSFSIAAYDKSKEFVIDPPLMINWQALYGGAYTDVLRAVTTDAQGNIYMTGYSESPNFPVWNGTPGAYFDGTFGGTRDAVIIKTSSTPNLLWATYMGGPDQDIANSITVDTKGRVYVAGIAGGLFPTLAGGGNLNNMAVNSDAFISRFSPALTLQWSTAIGGPLTTEEALKIYADSRSNIWVTGYAENGFMQFYNSQFAYNGSTTNAGMEAFAMLVDTLNNVKWSASYGGSGDDYATSCVVDTSGTFYVAGFTTTGGLPAGNNFAYSYAYGGATDGFIWAPKSNSQTYFGGSGHDLIMDITASSTNQLFITGRTQSANFPVLQSNSFAYYQGTLAGYYDAFVARFDMHANNGFSPELDWSTYYGGATNDESATAIACDKDNRVYITGFTGSSDFPLQASSQPGSFYQGTKGGQQDAFIAGFSMNGKRFWSTYKGGPCLEFANDITCSVSPNKIYVVGEGTYGCNQTLPDSGQIGSAGSADGFFWAFDGAAGCGSAGLQTTTPCPNDCNGTATLSLSGTAPYDISWFDGTNGLTTNLCDVNNSALDVKAWVDDANGCSYYFENYLEILTDYDIVSSPAGCFAWEYGSTLLIPHGGTPPYSMDWTSNTTTNYYVVPDQSGVITYEPGNFVYRIIDATGCLIGGNIDVLSYDYAPGAYLSITSPTSCGLNNGQLVAQDSLGGPVNVYWTINGVSQAYYGSTITNAAPGTYELDSFYSAGCNNSVPDLQTQVLTPSTPLSLSAVLTPIQCQGNNGAIDVTVSGGQQPYNYAWSDGSTSEDLLNVTTAYTLYDLYVTDNNGCELDTAFSLAYKNSPPHETLTIIRYPSCGLNNGILVALDDEGSGPPVDVQWILPDGSTVITDTLYNVGADYYSINNGSCLNGVFIPQTVFITASGSVLNAGITVNQNPTSCSNPNGALTVVVDSVNNYFPPYTFTWSNGATTQYLTGVPGGQPVTVTITDNAGCTTSATQTLVPPPAPVINAGAITPVSCVNDSNGAINPTYSGGGGAPYTYLWSTGATSAGISNLTAGQYFVTVTGANGCTKISNAIDVVRYNQQLLAFTETAPSCDAANGSIAVNTLAGNWGPQPYTYSWSTGLTGAAITGLSDGVYTVTMSTNGGASYTACVHFYATTNNVQAQLTTLPIACQGYTTVSATPTGGQAPYTILWNNGETAFSIAQTTSDTVRATVIDSLGCAYNLQQYVSVTPMLAVTANQTPVQCYGGTSTVLITATGGAPSYTGTGTFTLTAGSYSYLVTDNAGCADTAEFVINEPDELQTFYAAPPINCYGGMANISIGAAGGTPAYNGTGNFMRPAGSHTFVVADAHGCADTVTVTLSEPSEIITTVTAPTTFDCDAPVNVTVNSTGGTPPYTGTGIIAITPNLAASIIVTDHAGCKDTTNYQLTLPQGLSTTIIGEDTICEGQNAVFSATGNFDFTWQGNVQADTLVLNNVQASTTIQVQGISPEGCVVNDTATLVAEVCIGMNEIAQGEWKVFPNPATNQFIVELNGVSTAEALRVFSADGKLVSEVAVTPHQTTTVVDCHMLAAGVYLLQLQQNEKNYYRKLVIER